MRGSKMPVLDLLEINTFSGKVEEVVDDLNDKIRRINDFFRDVSENEHQVTMGPNGLFGSAFVHVKASSELTIASGVVTADQTFHSIDVETGSTDDLNTINGGGDGDIIIIKAEHADKTIVVKDGTGNLQTAGDFSMDNSTDTMMLINSGGSTWLELSRSNNGA
jgi:hypothetical protein